MGQLSHSPSQEAEEHGGLTTKCMFHCNEKRWIASPVSGFLTLSHLASPIRKAGQKLPPSLASHGYGTKFLIAAITRDQEVILCSNIVYPKYSGNV